jgi:hypothetical protein
MSDQTFAQYAASAPTSAPKSMHRFTCHMAALYWAFRDLRNSDEAAANMIEAICIAKCNGCQQKDSGGFLVMHGSLPHTWYGDNLCHRTTGVPDMGRLQADARLGDVLIVGYPARPAHSMVVVAVGAGGVLIRGYNNYLTLGTGTRDQYDDADRRVDVNQYWHTQGSETRFGQGFEMGGPVYRIPYDDYLASAGIVQSHMGRSWYFAGSLQYKGP